MIIILTDVDEMALLDRLLSSGAQPQHVCACQAAPSPDPAPLAAEPREAWSLDEYAALAGCRTLPQARRAYRKAFPASRRTDGAIKGAFRVVRMWAKSDAIASDLRYECSAETEMSGEPAGPVDSAIAAETGGPDPADEHEADLMDGAQCDAPLCVAPAPDQDLTLGTGPWVDHPEEDAAIVRAATSAEALQVYRQAFPDSPRSDGAVKTRWYSLQGTPSNDEQEPMLARSATVTILQPSSPYHGARGKIVRRNHRTREYLVAPDGSTSQIWLPEEYVRPFRMGGSP